MELEESTFLTSDYITKLQSSRQYGTSSKREIYTLGFPAAQLAQPGGRGTGVSEEPWLPACTQQRRAQSWRGVGPWGGHAEMLLSVCLPAHDQVPVHPIHARQENIQGQRGRGQDIRQLDGHLPPHGAFSSHIQ